jgi:hypothetical protein
LSRIVQSATINLGHSASVAGAILVVEHLARCALLIWGQKCQCSRCHPCSWTPGTVCLADLGHKSMYCGWEDAKSLWGFLAVVDFGLEV